LRLVHSTGRSAEEPCLIIYTSGSSGTPKGVVCSHQSVLSATNAIQRCLGYRPGDRVALSVPLTFDYGLYQAFLCMVSGACLVMYPPRSVGPGFVDRLDRDGITVLPSLPPLTQSIVSMCRRRTRQLMGLRLLTSTGADFGAALVQAARDVMPHCRVVPMYGLTECKRAAIQMRIDGRSHSAGQPIPGCRIAIVENGERLPPGQQGEIWVTGANVMSGYWPLDDKALNSRFHVDVFGRRWVASGDRGWLDDDGDLHVVGRLDDVFKRDGYRTSVAEIESALLESADVERVCVVPPTQELPFTAFYEGDIAPQTLRAFLSERLENYRIPENILQVSSIPLNSNGKIDRIAVRSFLKSEELSH